jgi:hypothetical protein
MRGISQRQRHYCHDDDRHVILAGTRGENPKEYRWGGGASHPTGWGGYRGGHSGFDDWCGEQMLDYIRIQRTAVLKSGACFNSFCSVQ